MIPLILNLVESPNKDNMVSATPDLSKKHSEPDPSKAPIHKFNIDPNILGSPEHSLTS